MMKRYCPTCSTEVPQEQKLCNQCAVRADKKIGGLLYLPLLVLFLTLYLFGRSLLGNITVMQRYYQQMNNDFRLYFIIVTIVNVLIVAYALVLVIMYLKKKRAVPSLSILFICLVSAAILIDGLVTNHLFGDTLLSYESLKPVFKMLIVTLIWVSYFLLSSKGKKYVYSLKRRGA